MKLYIELDLHTMKSKVIAPEGWMVTVDPDGLAVSTFNTETREVMTGLEGRRDFVLPLEKVETCEVTIKQRYELVRVTR